MPTTSNNFTRGRRPTRPRLTPGRIFAANVNLNAMASISFTPGNHQRYELAFARKTRSPSILERYIYTPFAALAGNSDGRSYLGNLDLVPEVSHEIALTGNWHRNA